MSNENNLGWLFSIEDYTTHLYRDYNKPLEGYLYNEKQGVFSWFQVVFLQVEVLGIFWMIFWGSFFVD